MNDVKGYKVFNSDWTCRDFQFEVGKVFEEDVEPKCCSRGFHFCLNVADCFNYYEFNSKNKVAEVIALGDVDYQEEGSKCCTNKLQIVREISWDEVLRIVNTGNHCTGCRNTGDCNTGDCNTGDCNTGDWNTGAWNTGNCNTGNCNTGNWNTGDWNTGNWNTGDWNTGDWNTGDWNTGDWNTGNRNTGCFNTKESKILFFNEPSEWTHKDWMISDARQLLNSIPKNVVEWVYEEHMTDKEKEDNPTYENTGGYLKILDESESAQIWWNGLSEEYRQIIRDIPNFDAEIFKECTGIDIY